MPRSQVFNREDVLNKAIEIFWQKGYHGSSIQDLTETTGLNRSSIYNSFGSKLDLYLQCLNHYRSENSGIFRKALMKGGDPLSSLKKIFALYAELSVKDDEKRGCMVINCQAEMSRQELAIREWLKINHNKNLQFFENLVNDGQNLGLINKRKPAEEYALYLLSSFQGTRIIAMTVDDKQKLDQIIDIIFLNLT